MVTGGRCRMVTNGRAVAKGRDQLGTATRVLLAYIKLERPLRHGYLVCPASFCTSCIPNGWVVFTMQDARWCYPRCCEVG